MIFSLSSSQQRIGGAAPARRRSAGFTLMELLVVVAILAVVGGIVIVAYDGLVGQASKGAATHSISALGSAVRNYQVIERELPDNLDSLVAVQVDPALVTFNPNVIDTVATGYLTTPAPVLTQALNPALRALPLPKLGLHQLTAPQLENLRRAGIRTIRYLDIKGEETAAPSTTLDIFAANSTSASPTAAIVGPLGLIEVPQQLFDAPDPVTTAKPIPNRGRGFAYNLVTATTLPTVARWLPDPANPAALIGYENVRVGGRADSVLIALGVGRKSTLVTAPVGAASTSARLDSTPVYGDVKKGEYPNYILLVDVSVNPARFVSVIDPAGGTHAENYAGGRGQQ